MAGQLEESLRPQVRLVKRPSRSSNESIGEASDKDSRYKGIRSEHERSFGLLLLLCRATGLTKEQIYARPTLD